MGRNVCVWVSCLGLLIKDYLYIFRRRYPSFEPKNLSRLFFDQKFLCFKFKTQQSPVILEFCLRKTGAAKSRDYRDVIIFERCRFKTLFCLHENEKPAFSNSSGFKAFSKSFVVWRDGLVWTIGLNIEINLRLIFKFLLRSID